MLPSQEYLDYLLKKYGDILFQECPSSYNLVLFADESDELPERTFLQVAKHLTICLDCRDKMDWLQQE